MPQYIHSSMDEHISYLLFWAITDKPSMNILVQVFLWICFISHRYIGLELLGHKVDLG